MKYIGIDPGFSGAWGMIDHNGVYRACGDMLHTDKYLLTQSIYAEIVDAMHGDDVEVVLKPSTACQSRG